MTSRGALFFACLAALCCAATGLSAQIAPGPQSGAGFGESIDVRVVNLEVYVTGRDGRRVTDLRHEDFELFEDGRKVEISHFDSYAPGAVTGAPTGIAPAPGVPEAAAGSPEPPPADPLYLVVYVDNVNVGAAHRARALAQVREFLDRETAPGDQVMIATYDLSLHVRQPFTDDKAALARTLDSITTLSARGDESGRDRRAALESIVAIQEAAKQRGDACPLEIAEPARSFAATRQNEVLRTISALRLLVNSLSGLPGRKAVLHISDGIPVTPGEEVFQELRLLVATQGPGGETSRVRQVQVPIQIPRDQALVALGREYLYDLNLTLSPGEQNIAVAVQDESTTKTSYLSRGVHVDG